jgi:hypothetical protein
VVVNCEQTNAHGVLNVMVAVAEEDGFVMSRKLHIGDLSKGVM